SPGATTCATCGAEVNAAVPTGARPPEEQTNVLPSPDISGAERAQPVAEQSVPAVEPWASQPAATTEQSEPPTIVPRAGSSWPGLTSAGLPTRVPKRAEDDEGFDEALRLSRDAAWPRAA